MNLKIYFMGSNTKEYNREYYKKNKDTINANKKIRKLKKSGQLSFLSSEELEKVKNGIKLVEKKKADKKKKKQKSSWYERNKKHHNERCKDNARKRQEEKERALVEALKKIYE